MIKYLALEGWQLDVLVPDGSTTSGFENELKHPNIRWIEVTCWRPYSRLQKWGQTLRRKTAPNSFDTPVAMPVKPRASWWRRLLECLRFPDEARWWSLHLLPALRRQLRHHPDTALLYVHGPPFSPMVPMVRFAKAVNLPLVVDFRDPWSDDSGYPYPFASLRPVVHAMEKEVLTARVQIVTVTPQLTQQLKRKYPDSLARFATVMNGYDPDDLLPALPSRKFALAHLGSLYGRNTGNFLQALARWLQRQPQVRPQVQVTFWGPDDVGTWQQIVQLKLQDVCSMPGSLPHAQLMSRLQEISLFLCFVGNRQADIDSIPGKLFEYVGMRRPVLGFGPAGVASEWLHALQWGHFFPPDALLDDVVAALEHYWQAWQKKSLLPYGNPTPQWTRQAQARVLSEICTQWIKEY